MRSRRDGHARRQPCVERRDHVGGVGGPAGVVLVPADRRHEHATPVDRELDVVRLEEATDGAEVGLEQARLEHVLAVQRERVARHDASARAERQPLHVRRLRRVAAHHVGLSARAEERRVAHRQSANLCRRRQIPFEERGGDPQCAGVVVEAAADVVGRQERRGVHVEPQEVAHGVGVLRAVQAAQRRRAGVPRRQPRRARARATRPVRRRPPGPASASPPAAWPRCAACAPPSPRSRRGPARSRCRGSRGRGPPFWCGRCDSRHSTFRPGTCRPGSCRPVRSGRRAKRGRPVDPPRGASVQPSGRKRRRPRSRVSPMPTRANYSRRTTAFRHQLWLDDGHCRHHGFVTLNSDFLRHFLTATGSLAVI